MDRSPAVEAVLAALIAVVLVGGLIGVAVVDEGRSASPDAAASSTTTPFGGPAGGAVDFPTTSAPPGSPTTSAASPPTNGGPATTATTAAAAAREPGPSATPKLGLYTYATTKNEQESTTELRVDRDREQAPGEDRFTYAIRESDNGNTITEFAAWRSDGVYVRKWSVPNPGGGPPIECDWEPDLLDRPASLRAGQQWSVDSTCKVAFGPAQGTFHLTGTGRVEGAKRVTAAGQSLDTWLLIGKIHVDVDLVYNGQPIHAATDTDTQEYYSPPHGLSVKTVEDTRRRDANNKETREYTTREITNLTPKP